MDYIDREFIQNQWPAIREKYAKRVAQIEAIQDFEPLMDALISKNLSLSHSQWITPQLDKEIEKQSQSGTVPDFLFPVIKETKTYVFVKIASFTIPIFSWQKLRTKLRQFQNDSRPIVLDFRLNAGGAISAVGELLTPFIGADIPFLYSQLASYKQHQTPQILYPQNERENTDNRLDVKATAAFPHAEWRTRTKNHFRLKQKIILLIDKRNHSCGEVFAQAMKEHSACVIIGQKTAGAVVGGRDDYDCGHGYRLLLPFVNLISSDGLALEGVGVTPDIDFSFQTPDTEVLSEQETQKILRQVL